MSGIGDSMGMKDVVSAGVVMNPVLAEMMGLKGRYRAECWRVAPELQPEADRICHEIRRSDEVLAAPLLSRIMGEVFFVVAGFGTAHKRRDRALAEFALLPRQLVWAEHFDNVVTDNGKKLALDSILGNAAAGAVVMGLKGSGSAAAADTQASHAGWLEVGLANLPTYTGNRQAPTFAAASGAGTVTKATSAANAFAITGTGTVAGAFLNIGGSATKDNTTGTLFSAGDFSVARSVISGDTVNVSYSLAS